MTHDEFDSEYLIGNDKIDKEHFIVFENIDFLIDLIKTEPENKAKIFDQHNKVVDYATFHFSSEMEEMTKHNYPYLETHKAAHDVLVIVLGMVVENFENPGQMLAAAQKLHDDLLDHMVQYDILYANYAKVMNAEPRI